MSGTNTNMCSKNKIPLILSLMMLILSCHNTEYRFYEASEGGDWHQSMDGFAFEVHLGSGIVGKIHAPDSFAVNIKISYKGIPIHGNSNNIFDSLRIDSFCISRFGIDIPQCPNKIYEEYAAGQFYDRVIIPASCDSIDVSFIAVLLTGDMSTELKKLRFRKTLYKRTERHSYYFE